MEKTTSSRLSNYIEKIAVLYPYQFGFRLGYSTDIALINMQELITKAIDTKKICNWNLPGLSQCLRYGRP